MASRTRGPLVRSGEEQYLVDPFVPVRSALGLIGQAAIIFGVVLVIYDQRR